MKKRPNSSAFLILIILALSPPRSLSQKSDLKCEIESIRQGIWIPPNPTDGGYYKVRDTIKKTLELIFEIKFDDSISIKVNHKNIYNRKIKSSAKSSVVEDEFVINYSQLDDLPTIEISLIEKKKCIRFKPLSGYRILYLVRASEGEWGIEYSNYLRTYR